LLISDVFELVGLFGYDGVIDLYRQIDRAGAFAPQMMQLRVAEHYSTL